MKREVCDCVCDYGSDPDKLIPLADPYCRECNGTGYVPTAEEKKKALVDGVKAHARLHYEEGAWDTIIECYSDADIEKMFGNATTLIGAVRAVRKHLVGYADRRRDIEAEKF